MVELVYLALSLASFSILDRFFGLKKANFLISLIPLILLLSTSNLDPYLIVSSLTMLLFIICNFQQIVGNYIKSVFSLVLIWLSYFMIYVESLFVIFMMFCALSIISFAEKISEKDWLYVYEKFMYFFVVICLVVIDFLTKNLALSNTAIFESLQVYVVFLILGNFRSEKSLQHSEKNESSLKIELSSIVDHFMIPLLLLNYFNNVSSHLDLEVSIQLILLALLGTIAIYWLLSVRHGFYRIILARISSFNMFSIVIFCWLTGNKFIELSYVALSFNFLMFEILKYNEKKIRNKKVESFLQGLFLAAPFSPVFLVKLHIMKEFSIDNNLSTNIVMILLLLSPIAIYPFLGGKELRSE